MAEMLFDNKRVIENEVVYFDNKWTKTKAMYDFRVKELSKLAVINELDKFSVIRITTDFSVKHLEDEHFWLMKSKITIYYNYYWGIYVYIFQKINKMAYLNYATFLKSDKRQGIKFSTSFTDYYVDATEEEFIDFVHYSATHNVIIIERPVYFASEVLEDFDWDLTNKKGLERVLFYLSY